MVGQPLGTQWSNTIGSPIGTPNVFYPLGTQWSELLVIPLVGLPLGSTS